MVAQARIALVLIALVLFGCSDKDRHTFKNPEFAEFLRVAFDPNARPIDGELTAKVTKSMSLRDVIELLGPAPEVHLGPSKGLPSLGWRLGPGTNFTIVARDYDLDSMIGEKVGPIFRTCVRDPEPPPPEVESAKRERRTRLRARLPGFLKAAFDPGAEPISLESASRITETMPVKEVLDVVGPATTVSIGPAVGDLGCDVAALLRWKIRTGGVLVVMSEDFDLGRAVANRRYALPLLNHVPQEGSTRPWAAQ